MTTKLTKTETRILDRYFSIYGQTFDEATFYQAVTQSFPTYRGEELFENDAYIDYLETLVYDYINI
jgi:hypothetical protein